MSLEWRLSQKNQAADKSCQKTLVGRQSLVAWITTIFDRNWAMLRNSRLDMHAHILENIFYLNYYLKHVNNIICNFHKILLHSTNPWTPDLTQFFGKSLLVVRKANLCKILLPISSGVLGGNLLIAPRRLPAMARNHFEGISRGGKTSTPSVACFSSVGGGESLNVRVLVVNILCQNRGDFMILL